MRSGKPTPCVPHPTLLRTDNTVSGYQGAKNRWDNCLTISQWAHDTGWRVTANTVNRHYTRYAEWYQGRYPAGYMVRNHGLARRKR